MVAYIIGCRAQGVTVHSELMHRTSHHDTNVPCPFYLLRIDCHLRQGLTRISWFKSARHCPTGIPVALTLCAHLLLSRSSLRTSTHDHPKCTRNLERSCDRQWNVVWLRCRHRCCTPKSPQDIDEPNVDNVCQLGVREIFGWVVVVVARMQ